MPIKVYNRASQTVEEVSSSEAQRGLQQGDYDLADKRVRVRKGNRTGSVAATDLLTAIGQGAELIDDAQAEQVKIEREESDASSQALAAAEAAAAGLTLGGSSWVEANILGVDPERMQTRREASGVVGDVAEIGGAIAPALATGGSSAAASGTSLAARGAAATARGTGIVGKVLRATPMGLASRGAAKLEGAVAARLGEGTLASRIVPTGVREFGEGAAQGVGAEIDDSVLGDRELAADRVAASGLMGGLFGAGAGIAVPGLARVAAGGARAPIESLRKVLGRTNASSGGLASREVAEMVADSADDGLNGVTRLWKKNAIAQGQDSEVADRLARMATTPEGRADITRLERDRPKIEREAAELLTERVPSVHASMGEARRLANGESKAGYWDRKISHTPEVQNAAGGAVDDIARTHRGELVRLGEENQRAIREFGGGQPYDSTMLYQAHQALATMERELVDAHNIGGRSMATQKAMSVDKYKRALGQLIEDNGGWGRALHVAPSQRITNSVLRQRYGEARELLERTDLWGGAAEAQAKINAAYGRYADADAAYKDATSGTGLGTIVNPDGSFNAFKAIKLVRAHGRTGGDVAVARLMDAMDARVAYFDEVARHVDMDDAGRGAIAKVKDDVEVLRREFKRQAVDAGKLDDLIEARRVEGEGSPSLLTTGTSLAGIIGFGVGGPIGALGGAALMAARQPYTSLKRYAAIQNLLDKTDLRLDRVVDGMFRATKAISSSASGVRAKLPRLPVGAIAGGFATRSGDEVKSRREQSLQRAGEYLGSGEAAARALSVPLYDVGRESPAIAAAIQDRVQRAASFLQSKAPQVYSRGSTKLVDPVSAASFERYLEAVVDPIAALERFEAGRITQETAEAIAIVYPALFADLQRRIQDELAKADAEGRELDYSRRVRLGQLFDTVTDPSMVATTQMEIQNSIGAEFDEPDAAQMMAAGKQAHPGKLEGGGESLQTSADRTATWKQHA